MIYKVFRHGAKSYEIMKWIFNTLFPARNDLIVLDLTYGKGRFYRLVRNRIKTLIGVDIIKHNWETKPDVFYNMPCEKFVRDVIENKIKLEKLDIIVVDPPWSFEKRRSIKDYVFYSKLPYHMNISSMPIIYFSMKLSKHLSTPLLYRYKEHLTCKHVLKADAIVNLYRHIGKVYYGVCSNF